MRPTFSSMSTPPPNFGPQPGYGAPPPGYGTPPQKNNTAKIVLIVLAVVFGGGIFLIGILAAILFPVFQKVRGNAQRSTCNSNVKQIELGLIEYEQDNNNKFPSSAAGYKDAVFPYLKSEALFHCPTDHGGPVDYSLNTNLQGVSVDKLANPASVVAVYEGENQTLSFRHDGKAVVGFADGHVQDVTQEQTSSLNWTP